MQHMTSARWLQLMDSWQFAPNRDTFELLCVAYSDAGRHYHTGQHISACLGHLDRCLNQLQQPQEVELALWFHDAVYDPHATNNEQLSADWAANFLCDNGADEARTLRVHELIMTTEHGRPTRTLDQTILVDIDLSILGSKASIYNQFEVAIRREYAFVPWDIYREKRTEVLRGFFEREPLYTSGCLPTHMEQQAKRNLCQTINELKCRD